jgi:hypothetical protein
MDPRRNNKRKMVDSLQTWGIPLKKDLYSPLKKNEKNEKKNITAVILLSL